MLENKRTVNKRSLYGQVATTLGERIVDGYYQQGVNLPQEAKIMAEFDISRTALREAFKLLSAKGLIESKPKTGTKVAEQKYWNLFDPDVLNWCFASAQSNKVLQDLFQLRQSIEPTAAQLAAYNATEQQITAIESAYLKMETAEYGTPQTLLSDVEFHQAVLAASGNILIESFGTMLAEALYRSFDITTNQAEENWLAALPLHKAVLVNIQNRDSAAAQAAMLHLLDTTNKSIKNAN
ncbi:transcriptional regulator of arabinose utilization operon, AraR [Catenovulum agarivorans DS-2]|uniref:Transcriptional regulator of arabinose utilization operon, AraR n=1 Tax=Catenovulum agarivorans DS-2 TaxID=1328313 RepID=W7QBH5_9ALTE|nr:FadR/GntR family transcriptional regulator [Catenovulum agarivorans]EWH10154.1 transcriptional regulator of arabinose utilization operon, AraR [Catenovulum agarivorans DS-2]